MKNIVFYSLFLLSFQLLYGQLNETSILDKTDISPSVTVGTAIGNNFSGTFLAPNISQTVNSKLSLNYGAVFSNNSASYFFIDNYGNGYAMPSSSNTFYVDGTYKVNDKISVKSTIIIGQHNFDNYSKDFQNFNSNMYMMGIEYKLSENVRIQADFGVSKGFSPYSNLLNPYDRSPFNYGLQPFYSPIIGY